MSRTSLLSPCGQLAKQHDRERYLCALFAPTPLRERLFTLLAFNYEVAKIREMTQEPMVGMIRLQWWREAIGEIYAGKPRQHPVILPLARYIEEAELPHYWFEELITARESDLDTLPHPDMASLERYIDHTSSHLFAMGVRLSGAPEMEEAARQVGRAWALIGLLRISPQLLRQQRSIIPRSLLTEAEITEEALFAGEGLERLMPISRMFAEQAATSLQAARRHPVKSDALPVLLPATIADMHLSSLKRQKYDIYHHPLPPAPGWLPLVLLWHVLGKRY